MYILSVSMFSLFVVFLFLLEHSLIRSMEISKAANLIVTCSPGVLAHAPRVLMVHNVY